MYTKMLIPVAFEADKELANAIEIANRIAGEGAAITFLHVVEQVPG